MASFTVTIEETVCQNFIIEASTAAQALTVATAQYHDGALVLEPGEPHLVQMAVTSPDESATDWGTL